MGEVITGKEMTDVPLVTRSYTDLLALQPGVTATASRMTGAYAGSFISAGFPAPLVSGRLEFRRAVGEWHARGGQRIHLEWSLGAGERIFRLRLDSQSRFDC